MWEEEEERKDRKKKGGGWNIQRVTQGKHSKEKKGYMYMYILSHSHSNRELMIVRCVHLSCSFNYIIQIYLYIRVFLFV